MTIDYRELEVFRPYEDEFPEALLWEAGADDDCCARWRAAQMVRIARHAGELAAVYAMDRLDLTSFQLHGVVVARRWRRQGLGRWIIGHAIGVAESKGGRGIVLPSAGGSRCFSHIGFERQGDHWRYDLIPE